MCGGESWALAVRRVSAGLFLGGLYVSYKYFEVAKFEKSFKEINQNKYSRVTRKLFFELHDRLAPNFERILSEEEQRHGVTNFRKSILKFAKGVAPSDPESHRIRCRHLQKPRHLPAVLHGHRSRLQSESSRDRSEQEHGHQHRVRPARPREVACASQPHFR